MSRMWRIGLAWLVLPLVAWLSMQVFATVLEPLQVWMMHVGLSAQLWLMLIVAALGHAALFAWPLVRIYGRAAGAVVFVMIWPLMWQRVGLVFDDAFALALRWFWAVALISYVLTLWVAVRLVLRGQSPASFRRGPVSVETLIRRHQRAVMQRLQQRPVLPEIRPESS
jgi:hypothetical protein